MAPMNSARQVRARLLGDPADDFRLTRRTAGRVAWLGWGGPLFFMLVGGFMRFWHVGAPHQLVFDETYYVKQGWSMVLYWFEMKNDEVLQQANQVDQHFTANDPMIYGTEGDFVVHPPVGKWLIGWGEAPFGILNSFGWRFAVALAGTISIFMLGRIARRLFRSDLLGTVAAALLAFEGHHFVHSRTGLLDIFVMFFGLAAFGALLIDRDRAREVLARRVGDRARSATSWMGPWLGWRPWRWVAGIMLGLCAGVKWSGLYFLVFFGLLTVLWDLGARRAAGVRGWSVGGVVKDGPYAFVQVAVTAVVTYVASWTGWILTKGGSFRTWAQNNPDTDHGWLPDWWRSLWAYHQQMYASTQAITRSHPYQTNPWSWLIQGRPTSFFYEGPEEGRRRVPRRPVQQGDHLARHRVDLVGRDARDLRAAVHVGAAPGLARRRDPLRPVRRLPAVVLPRQPDDLLLLRGGLRAVRRARLRLRARARHRRARRVVDPAPDRTGRDGGLRPAHDGAVRVLPPHLRRRRHPALGVAGAGCGSPAGSEGYTD